MARVGGAAWLTVVSGVLFLSSAAAQIVDVAWISGVVQDSSGARIASAKITVRSQSTEWTLSVVTNNEGVYITPPLAPGHYELMVEAKGFAPLIRQVHVEVAQHPSVDVALNLGAANET